jgi:DNA end-binding protein Ku
MRKGFPVDATTMVILSDAELDRLAPPSSRKIEITRFVPRAALPLEWFDRPYFLGAVPDHVEDYNALAQSLARQERYGIARWVMRKRAYAGALCSQDDHLLLVTLHSPDEIVAVADLEPPPGRELTAEERSLAVQLIDSLSGTFNPREFRDTYEEKVRELVEAKRAGKKARLRRPTRRPPAPARLADALRRSIRASGA